MIRDGQWVCVLHTPVRGAIPVYFTRNRALGKQVFVTDMPIAGTVMYIYPTNDQRAPWVYVANQTGPLATGPLHGLAEAPTHRIP
jgi:hypothetical protein